MTERRFSWTIPAEQITIARWLRAEAPNVPKLPAIADDAIDQDASELPAQATGSNTYTETYNIDLLALIQPDAEVILDVGCGTGALGNAYRGVNRGARLLGIERDPNLAALARQRLNDVACVDVEQDPLPFPDVENVDCIIYGDVLQHLRNPWTVVRSHLQVLTPNGVILICFPNAEHWSLASRIFQNRWNYDPNGLLDRGHLRWLTFRMVKNEIEQTGLEIEMQKSRVFDLDRARGFVAALSPALSELGIDPQEYAARSAALQYVIRAKRRVGVTARTSIPSAAAPECDEVTSVDLDLADSTSVSPGPGPEISTSDDPQQTQIPTTLLPEPFPFAGEPSDVKPMATVENPSFRATYPEVYNAELIPPFPLHSMEESWKRQLFEPQSLNVYRIDDGIVAHEALVFDRYLRILPSSAHASSKQEVQDTIVVLRKAFETNQMPRFPNDTVVVRARATNNYGHYLVEMFPRAYIAKQLIHDRRLDFLVHRTNARMLDVVYQSLSLIGIGLDQITITGNEPVQFKHLVAFEGLTKHGSYMSPLAVEALESMASGVKPGPPRRLFVSRSGARNRRLLNEADLASSLEGAGYFTVDTSEMSLRDQIALFAGAERVIGVLGAAMTNIVFCQPGTTVAMLTPCAYPDTFFWFLSTHKRHRYIEVRCEQQQPHDGTQSWNAGFFVRQREIDFLLSL